MLFRAPCMAPPAIRRFTHGRKSLPSFTNMANWHRRNWMLPGWYSHSPKASYCTPPRRTVFADCSQRLFTIEKSPSPAGRSPQRGRVGEGVGNIIDELKFQFFRCLLPSPQPPPKGTGTARAARQSLTRMVCCPHPAPPLPHGGGSSLVDDRRAKPATGQG